MTEAAHLPGWRHVHSGKVRDVYAAQGDPGVLLLVASDRVSAYDHVLPTPIPGKGAVLTALSHWWFQRLADIVANHLVDPARAPEVPAGLVSRATLARRLDMVPFECVGRAHLAGSAWQEYRRTGEVAGVRLPPGLQPGDELPEPIFTPATKAPAGRHDENITTADLRRRVGRQVGAALEELTLAVLARGVAVAGRAGLLLADTKLEFGVPPGGGATDLVLADEVLTPDSSRYWDATGPPGVRAMFDKQIVRDWLTGSDSGWSAASGALPPPLPADVVARTAQRYQEVLARLTGVSA